jgi:maltodextrin utilization protein YvdJ
MTLSWQEEKKKKKKKMKQTLNEQIGRIKSMMNINEDDQQMAMLQQATQEFNEKAEEDLTPDELQEVACTSPDSIELPTDTTNEHKQKFEEFKVKVKEMVKARDIDGLKQAKKQLKDLKNQSKQQQNEQAFTGTLYTVIGIQMPLGFVIFLYGFLFLLILNGILSIFGIHIIRNVTDWCTGRKSVGYSVRFGRRD